MHELLFGVRTSVVDAVADRLGAILGITFEQRDSDFQGAYCLFRGEGGRVIRIKRNRDPLYNAEIDPPEDQYFEAQFPDHGVLVYANLPADELDQFAQAVRAAHPDVVVIRG